jgi:hypothetical protein
VRLAQPGSRLQPELVAEQGARLLVGPQRLLGAPEPVLGTHTQGVQALPQRALRERRLELQQRPVGRADGQQ